MRPAVDLGLVLTGTAIAFEVAFVFWYVTMIVIMWRALKDESGKVDYVTLGLVGIWIYGLLHTILLIDDFWQLHHPANRLAIRIGLDIFRVVVVTIFMWHLRLKELLQEWLKENE